MAGRTQTDTSPFDDVEGAMRSFSDISESLVASYEALSARAEHVEAELGTANEELERKVAELDAVKRHLEAILDSLPTGVVVKGADGRVALVNDAALEILGCGADELRGAVDFPGLSGARSSAAPEERETPDGRTLVVASRYSEVRDEAGSITGSVEILDDQTAITRMGERVHQLDKMAALGTVAGGIAHEIRNPMNGIRGFAALLRRGMEPGSKDAHWAGLICEGVDEIDTIIASLITLAQPEQLHLELVDGPALVGETLAAVRRDLERAGNDPDAWRITSSAEECSFAGDRIKLRQALRNLVANAIEAQPDGGRVHVDLVRCEQDVCVRVTDAGPGIAADIAPKALDPFFTTRAEGTGLGLPLVHTIAQLHGGGLEIEAEPSSVGGAIVVLRIPFCQEADLR